MADSVAAIRRSGAMNVTASASGVLLYSAANSLSQFIWLDRTGKAVGVVGEPGEYGTFRLSQDGRRAAVSRDRAGGSDLWLLDVERPGAKQLALNSSVNICPAWSPDGRTIAFSSGYPRDMFLTGSSGATKEQRLSQSPRNQFVSDWSRDGRWIMYHEMSPDTSYDLGIVPMTAGGMMAPGATPKLSLQTPANEGWGRFSPVSPPNWVAYHSDVTGRFEIYVQALPEAHGSFQISVGGGRYPQWGADGRELFYVSPENSLMAVDLKVGANSVEPSQPRELFPIPVADLGFSPYDTTADGERFLVRAMLGGAGQPLTVIVNWPTLLK